MLKRELLMFMGEYSHTIDPKGRLIIPSRFRDELGDEFVLTKGLDGCLSIYPRNEWEAFEQKLRDLPLTNKNARTFTRFFVAGASLCELDKQGRIQMCIRDRDNPVRVVYSTAPIGRQVSAQPLRFADSFVSVSVDVP